MICLFKNRSGNIKFGDYAVAPSEATYNSVADIPNNSYASLTQEQLERYNSDSEYNRVPNYVIDNVVPTLTLEQLKGEKQNELMLNYREEIKKGYTYDSIPLTIKKDEKDIDLFNKQLNGVRSLIDVDNAPSIVPLLDINGSYTELNLATYQQLMASYFLHNQNLYFTLSQKQAQINSCVNENELNSLDLEF
jgi:hypothetical protein